MGFTGVLTLMLPVAVLCILPPSPVFPGPGPKGDPPVIPIDHQRCVAMKRESRRTEVPVPYFCHPRDPAGIPMPQQLDPQVLYMMMRLQWSGYRVCSKKITVPTHRYVPVPVCCRGWQRGPTGKCDTPAFNPPSALTGPCLNGGILKKNGKCCYCPPGFSGPLCQHTAPPSRPGTPFPTGDPVRPPPIRPTMSVLPPQIRNRVNQLLQLREVSNRKSTNSRPVPITPTLVKKLTGNRSPVPINTAYINNLPRRPHRPVKPMVNTASINKLVRNQPPRVPTNTAYINQLPTRNTPPRRLPVNTAYINQLPTGRPSQQRIPINTAYINQLPKQNQNPRRLPVNTAYINQLPKTNPTPSRIPINTAYINQLPKRNPTPVRLPTNTAYINQLPKKNPTPRQPINTAYINQLPRNTAPRRLPASIAYINRRPQMPVAKPPLNTANINPYVNPRPLRITVNTAHINKLPKIDPRRNRPVVNTAYINQLTGPRRPIPNPRQTAYINRLLQRIPPNSPRPVIAPPVVVAPVLGVNPMFNPTAVNIVPPMQRINPVQPPVIRAKPVQTPVNPTEEEESVEGPAEPEPTKGDNPDIVPPREGPKTQPQGQLPGIPRLNTPAISPEAQCQRILEVGVTRCFRDAGILAGPRDIFNPQNPEVARNICSQGKRLQPCIMAGETACGQGMRVIITRRMLASLLTAIGHLCTSVPMTTQNRKLCINGGKPVNQDGRQVCDCPQGFGGELCEIPICVPACENDGLCENVDGSAKCVCTSGFYGERCENAVLPVTTVTDPKPVDPPTHSAETSPNPVPVTKVPVTKIENKAQKITHDGEKEKIDQETNVAKMQIFGYPLWFVLAIILGLFGFLLVSLISCCLCLRCKRQKRNFEVTKEAVKMPVLDNVYTVGVVPPVYEAKGIPPLSYEEAKGETIRGLAKDLEKEVTDEKEEKEEEK